MESNGMVERASSFHPWDAMAPAALSGILRRGPFRMTAETGCGGSTIVLSNTSDLHLTFAIEGEDRTITELRARHDLQLERVLFIEGESKETLPRYGFKGDIDLALLDGPHAYPLPQLEFSYLFPHVRVGGWLVIDDIQIPSVHELFRFLRQERSLKLEEVIMRTAFFKRTEAVNIGPDGWPNQGMNRRTLLRYSWRDRLRKLVVKPRSIA